MQTTLDHFRITCFGFYIGVLDKGRLKAPTQNDIRLSETRIHITMGNETTAHNVVLVARVKLRRFIRLRLCDVLDSIQLRPCHWKITDPERRNRIRLPYHHGHGFAFETRLVFGKDRLVNETRNRTE